MNSLVSATSDLVYKMFQYRCISMRAHGIWCRYSMQSRVEKYNIEPMKERDYC